ncbi:MAG TPA: hypothetical protein VFB62_25605 [Polyangiaceae bacterium]|nr:hypothetical protein [Polyangiaceae bacterium]
MIHRTLWLIVALLVWPSATRADEVTDRCVRGHVEGQRKRKAGDLEAARRELRSCIDRACPDLVRRDCVAWLREVDQSFPTLVFGAQDDSGADLSDVSVFVDGRLAQRRLSGKPVEVRPGKHKVRFESRGRTPSEKDIIVAYGEKNRVVRATLAAEVRDDDPLRFMPFVLGGFGLAAVTAGIALDVVGTNELDELRDSCAPNCNPSDVDSTRNKIIAGDTLLAVGIAAVGAAAIWLVIAW